jgi:putative transport protein
MLHSVFQLLAQHPFLAIFFVLGFGYLLGRVSIGFFSVGSTAGSLLVALLVGAMAFELAEVRFQIPDLVGTIFLALFTYAVGLRVGPQFVDGLRREGAKLITLVMVTTTAAFAIAFGGSRLFDLEPGFAPGILSGSNTISAVMGAATAVVDDGLFKVPDGMTVEHVKANIAAAYSLTYIVSVLGIVLLVRNLPGMFGIDPVAAAKESEKAYGAKGHPLPGTSAAFELGMPAGDVRVFRLTNDAFVGRPVAEVFARLNSPVLRVTRQDVTVPLQGNPRLEQGDLLTVGGQIAALLEDVGSLGPEVADEKARHLDIDQADIVVTDRQFVDKTLEELHASRPAYGTRVRAVFRGGHEMPVRPGTRIARHDVLRVIGPPEAVTRLTTALGQAVRPTNATDIITLGLGIGSGYLVGLVTIPIAGIPIGLGTMGGIVVAGMVVSVLRAINPAFGGPMPEGARAFLESIGVDLFVTTLGLTVAPALVLALAQGRTTLIVLLLGTLCAVVPTFISWLVGLYILKMDPMVLAGAVSGARNSTTAMRAISDKSKSTIPSFGYPVPYALSTVVFLIYGYVAMLLS